MDELEMRLLREIVITLRRGIREGVMLSTEAVALSTIVIKLLEESL